MKSKDLTFVQEAQIQEDKGTGLQIFGLFPLKVQSCCSRFLSEDGIVASSLPCFQSTRDSLGS